MSEPEGHSRRRRSRAGPRSGEKYLTPQGFTAIRDGIKARAAHARAARRRASPPGCGPARPPAAGFQACGPSSRSTASPRCAKRPSARTSASAGTPAPRPSCSWARCARAPAASARSTPAIRTAGSIREEPENAAAHGRADEAQVRRAHLGRTATTCPTAGAAHYAACVRAIKRAQSATPRSRR